MIHALNVYIGLCFLVAFFLCCLWFSERQARRWRKLDKEWRNLNSRGMPDL